MVWRLQKGDSDRYPSKEALSALIQRSYGCFEQTSSVNYPLVLAQQYFKTHAGVSPDKIRQADEMLEIGYKRIQGFECKNGGFEWYGKDPGHEALTAYGLKQFTEMIEAGQIASYEIIGRELMLYWRSLGAKERVELSIPLTALIPGTYTGPASRAYAFYADEHMHWIAGETIVIAPK